jgi:transcriptional regulator with XRE-family HTH domain
MAVPEKPPFAKWISWKLDELGRGHHKALAEHCGYDVSTVSRWKSGERVPTTSKDVYKIAEFFDEEPEDVAKTIGGEVGAFSRGEVLRPPEPKLARHPRWDLLRHKFDADRDLTEIERQMIIEMIEERRRKEEDRESEEDGEDHIVAAAVIGGA